MCHWKKWLWPGLLSVAILTLLALWWKADIIENDLRSKATAALAEEGQGWVKVEMDGRDAVISGSAPSEAAQDVAELVTSEQYDVRIVDNRSGLIAVQSPYTLSAKRNGDKVELNGFVPNETTRAKVLASVEAAIPGAKITDKMTLARGAPENLTEISDFGVKQLGNLANGEMSLSDTKLSLKGAAPDQSKFGMVNTALAAALPAGATLLLKEITAPVASPYTWSADYKDNGLELRGFVPSDAMRASIAAKAADALPGIAITDSQQIASGEPTDFAGATGFALEQLKRFSNGSVSLSDKKLVIVGVSKDSASYEAAKAAISGTLPAGLVLASEKIVPSTVSPYTWNAGYDGKTVTLGGYIPNMAARDAISAEAGEKFPTAAIVDEMQIAAGAPNGFLDASSFSLQQLSRFSSGEISLSDLNLAVSGTAKDVESYGIAKAAIGGALPSGLKLFSEKITAATVSPYIWSVALEDSTATLSGFVPDDGVRKVLAAKARQALGVTVVDEMKIAEGAPKDFAEAASFGVEQMQRFSSGSASLSDLNLSIEGRAKDNANYDAVKAAMSGTLPFGLTLASDVITRPLASPYNWGAKYDGKTVTLDGFVPDRGVREKIAAAAGSQFPRARIVDEMKFAAGAPTQFGTAAIAAIGLLPKLSRGSVALSDEKLTVKGTAKTEVDFAAVSDAVKGDLAGGTSLALADIKPAPVVVPKDYTWEVERRGNAIILSGFAPSKEERRAIADRASKLFPGATVVNRIVPRSDAPSGFNGSVGTGLNLLTRLSAGKATIVNRKMSIVGQASSVTNYEVVVAETAETLKDGYAWNILNIKPASVSPYTWAIIKGAESVEQSGFVPSRGFGNSMVSATSAALGMTVKDQQRVAAGEPENFGNAVAAAITAVGKLDDSRASITDTNISVQGRAAFEAEAARIRAEIADSIPVNFKLRTQISYPLPKPAPKPIAKVKPKPEPEPAPKPVVKVEPKPEPQPAPKPIVKAEPKPASKPKVVVKVEPKPKPAPPKVVKIVPKPAPPPKIACEVRIRNLIAGEKIQFATDRAWIKSESTGLLNRIAREAKSCPNAKFEVWGHTDARGWKQYNQQLSEARAKSVVTFLAGAGVKPENLQPIGYGELRPIESNETIEGRAANRRIEFVVVSY